MMQRVNESSSSALCGEKRRNPPTNHEPPSTNSDVTRCSTSGERKHKAESELTDLRQRASARLGRRARSREATK